MKFKFRKPINRKARQKGFTLIEVMVVVTVILIGAGMLMMKLGGQPDTAVEGALRNNVQVLNTLADAADLAGGPGTVDRTSVQTIVDTLDGAGLVVTNRFSGEDETYQLPEGFHMTTASYTIQNGVVAALASATVP